LCQPISAQILKKNLQIKQEKSSLEMNTAKNNYLSSVSHSSVTVAKIQFVLKAEQLERKGFVFE